MPRCWRMGSIGKLPTIVQKISETLDWEAERNQRALDSSIIEGTIDLTRTRGGASELSG